MILVVFWQTLISFRLLTPSEEIPLLHGMLLICTKSRNQQVLKHESNSFQNISSCRPRIREVKRPSLRDYKENFKSWECLHCRAARIIYKLPRYMPSEDVLSKVGWNTLFFYYKTAILELICKIIKNVTPNSMSDLASRRECDYSLRAKH